MSTTARTIDIPLFPYFNFHSILALWPEFLDRENRDTPIEIMKTFPMSAKNRMQFHSLARILLLVLNIFLGTAASYIILFVTIHYLKRETRVPASNLRAVELRHVGNPNLHGMLICQSQLIEERLNFHGSFFIRKNLYWYVPQLPQYCCYLRTILFFIYIIIKIKYSWYDSEFRETCI